MTTQPEHAERRGSLGKILHNTGWMLGGKGFGAVVSTIYLAIVTRSLGLEGFGQFALVLGAGQGVATFVAFQSWQIVVRYGMPHLHAGRSDALARLLRFTTFVDIAAALIGAAVIVPVVLLLGWHFGWEGDFIFRAVAICMVLVLSTHWTPVGILRLRDRFATATFADATTPMVRFLGALVVWLTGPSVIGYLAVWAVAEAITAAAYWVSALRTSNVSWRLDRPWRWSDIWRENPGIRAYAVTTNLLYSLDAGAKQLTILIVGLIAAPAAAGQFRFSQQLAQAMGKLSQMLARAIFPELMRSRAGEETGAHFDRLLARTVRLTAAGGAIVFALLLLIGRPAIDLIAGPQFASAYPILLLLGTAAALDFAAVGFEPALAAMGRAGLALRLRFVTTALMFSLMALLAPRWGAIGAAASVLAASAASALLLWLALKRFGRS